MSREARLRAALRLQLAEGVGPTTFRRLTEAFGGPEGVFAKGNSPDRWRRVEGIGQNTAQAIQAVTDQQIDDELRLAERHGSAILMQDDPDFPAALKGIHDCPPVLYVRGRLEPADAVALGVVGSRRCTYYGLEQAERFSQLLARAGFTVVSGGARGIDAAAHRGALAGGGRTIAVMGCGLSRTYPPDNQDLFDRIVADGRGAIVSELPMRAEIRAGNFHSRNRLISGLSLGVLVVEAARHSGALITAGQAIEQGREVFAVPGRVDSAMSQGTNDLIRRHEAKLVQDLDDILEELGELGRAMSPAAPTEGEPSGLPAAGLDETQRKLVEALRGGPAVIDELIRRTGLEAAKVAASLTILTVRGVVAQLPGRIFTLKSRRGKAT